MAEAGYNEELIQSLNGGNYFIKNYLHLVMIAQSDDYRTSTVPNGPIVLHQLQMDHFPSTETVTDDCQMMKKIRIQLNPIWTRVLWSVQGQRPIQYPISQPSITRKGRANGRVTWDIVAQRRTAHSTLSPI